MPEVRQMDGPKIQVYQDEGAAWRWHLIARNGEVVAQGESHSTEQDARRAALRAAELLDEAADTMHIERAVEPPPEHA